MNNHDVQQSERMQHGWPNTIIVACLFAFTLTACGSSDKQADSAPKDADTAQTTADKTSKTTTATTALKKAAGGIAVPPPAPAITGTYRSARGQLDIRQTTTPSVYRFWITLDEQNSCTGQVNGFITLTDNQHADFSVEGCDLKFLFHPRQVQISESGTSCGDYHGPNCAFSSIYVMRTATTTATSAPQTVASNTNTGLLTGRFQQMFTTADGQQCYGWMLEIAGSSQQPAAKGIWYQGNCQAKAVPADHVTYDANSHRLTLTLRDAAGGDHHFSGMLQEQQLFQGKWE